MAKIDYSKVYEQGHANLNQKQKEAVDTIKGPVMVVAGPGTGKTQILSYRVTNILTNYDVRPEEIVCLTFTEAGASEMLNRIEKLIGEEGRKVRVSTIHSFCSDLILGNSDKFGDQPEIISTAAQYEILKEIMDEDIVEDDSLFRNSGDRYSSKNQLISLYLKMKREKLESKDIQREIDEYFKSIELSVPGDELYAKFKYAKKWRDKQPGDLKANFEKELSKFDKLTSGAHLVEKYKNKISEKNYFDFDDMVMWAIEKLEELEDFQKEVSSGIKYLFVDEFQDTSVVQNKLVDLLVKGKTNPNIFVVGDDDQSIYRFQGVSADNIPDFDKKYNPVKIVLEENYRSSQAIIDASKQLISNNPREEKHLIAAGENKEYTNLLPTLTVYESEEEEMLGTLNQILELVNQGVLESEIGVIYGRNAYGGKFAKLLRANGIFVRIKEKRDLFSDPFFKKVIAILKYICMPTRKISELRKILYFDFFSVSTDELAILRDTNENDTIYLKNVNEIDQKLEFLRKKISLSKNYLSPMFILSEVIKTFEIDKYIMEASDKYHLVSVIKGLYDLMLVEVRLHPKLSLRGFLIYLSGLQEMKVTLDIEDISGSPKNCVQLMTAHGAKGLEFDYVFMLKCNDGKRNQMWPGGENKSGSFSYPPSLNKKEENEAQLNEEENRRLFYVAMTRAKKELHLSYSSETSATHFLYEFKEHMVIIDKAEVNPLINSVPEVKVPKLSAEILNNILVNFSLSVSTLNSFLNCTLSFYFNKCLKFPSESNEMMIFGNMVHETLEGIYVSDDGKRDDLAQKLVLSKEDLLLRFEDIFEKSSWKLSSERMRKDDYSRGISIIENLYNQPEYIKPGIIAVEKTISGIKLGDIKNTTVDLSEVANFEINGKIDKIEMDGDVIRLIDYKTGNAKNAAKKMIGPTEDDLLGGDYWRQAVFYYILLTNCGLELTDKKVLIKYVFVENAENEKGFSETPDIEVTQDEVDSVLEQVKGMIKQLESGEFNCGCGNVTSDRSKGIYPCDSCIQASLNFTPPYDNTKAVEVATFEQTINNFKSLSVSKLNRFINCSKSFYFDDVLQLTTAAGLTGGKKEHTTREKTKHIPTGAVFGTVIHETMEKIYRDNLDFENAITVFNKSLAIHESEIIDTMPAEEIKKYGYHLLENLFIDYIPNSLKDDDINLEKEIYVTLDGMYPINGIIDKLEFDGDTIRVVDYKTGSAQRGVEELEVGKDYWRQAAYYNLLLQISPDIDTTNKKIETQYIFLDDENSGKGYSIRTISIGEEDTKAVEAQIHEMYHKMRAANFTYSCHRDDCDFCRLGEFVDFETLKNEIEHIR